MTMMMMIMRLWKQQVASMHAYVCMDERAHHSADIAAFLKATSTRFYCCAHRFLIFRQQQKKKTEKKCRLSLSNREARPLECVMGVRERAHYDARQFVNFLLDSTVEFQLRMDFISSPDHVKPGKPSLFQGNISFLPGAFITINPLRKCMSCRTHSWRGNYYTSLHFSPRTNRSYSVFSPYFSLQVGKKLEIEYRRRETGLGIF